MGEGRDAMLTPVQRCSVPGRAVSPAQPPLGGPSRRRWGSPRMRRSWQKSGCPVPADGVLTVPGLTGKCPTVS